MLWEYESNGSTSVFVSSPDRSDDKRKTPTIITTHPVKKKTFPIVDVDIISPYKTDELIIDIVVKMTK